MDAVSIPGEDDSISSIKCNRNFTSISTGKDAKRTKKNIHFPESVQVNHFSLHLVHSGKKPKQMNSLLCTVHKYHFEKSDYQKAHQQPQPNRIGKSETQSPLSLLLITYFLRTHFEFLC